MLLIANRTMYGDDAKPTRECPRGLEQSIRVVWNDHAVKDSTVTRSRLVQRRMSESYKTRRGRPPQFPGMHIMPRLTRCALVFVASFVVVPRLAVGQARPPATVAVLRSGTLSFLGHATVGDFIGATSSISGMVGGELATAHGWVEAPVGTLVTGNDHRDRDMRASLEADQYPTMRFDLAGVTTISSASARGETLALALHGNLAIHGVTRLVDLPARVVLTGDTIHVTAAFPLDLADYHIGGLTKMFGLLRMQRQIEVRLDLRFVRTASDDTEDSQ